MARLSQMGKTATVIFTSGFTAEVQDIQLSGPSRDEVAVTHYASGDLLEFDPAARSDAGTADMVINFDPEVYDTVIGQITSTSIETVTVTFPLSDDTNSTPATLVFQGYVSALPLGLPSVGGISASMTYRLTSEYTFTPETV